jgi:ADP-ribose pyrophosphatase YjhB (NUDIX family)
MSAATEPRWLVWARRLQALAQSGLAYSPNPFDRERFEEIRAIAAEMMAACSGEELERVLDLFTNQSGYATPKVDVRGVAFDERGRILLVKERADGMWTLPGGWADVSDTPSAAVEREVFEESGYRAKAVKLLAVWDRTKQGHRPPRPFRIYKIVIRCELTGGSAAESLETAGAGFFAEDALPPLSLARVTPSQIARLFEHYRHPEWPADFD